MSSPVGPTIHSALASPRSSTSSVTTEAYAGNPPLTPMSDLGLEKGVEALLVAGGGAEGEGMLDADGVGRGPGPATPEKAAAAAALSAPRFTPSTQAYRTRPPPARLEAQNQFAAFSFGRPLAAATGRAADSSSVDDFSSPTDTSFPPVSSSSSSSPPPPAPRSASSLSPPASPSTSRIAARPYPSPSSPAAGFSFGTCPSAPMLNTPTAELGAFEYPDAPDEGAGPAPFGSQSMQGRAAGGSSTSMSSTYSSSSSSSSASASASGYNIYPGGQGSRTHSRSSSTRGSIPIGLALGESHRRNSIISRPSLVRHPSGGGGGGGSGGGGSSSSTHTLTPSGQYPSPPQTRRSSTMSTIHTLPSTRRPSILHSSTVEVGAGMVLPSVATMAAYSEDSTPTPSSPLSSSAGFTRAHAGYRRPSLLFPPKHLPQPVPPSLLARRGSMPAQSLAHSIATGLGSNTSPSGSYSTPRRATGSGSGRVQDGRSSISVIPAPSDLGTYGYGHPGQLTAHRLYNRRESVLSEGSTGSGGTIMGLGEAVADGAGERRDAGGQVTRRSSMREGASPRSSLGAAGGTTARGGGGGGGVGLGLDITRSHGGSVNARVSPVPSARRMSMPVHHIVTPQPFSGRVAQHVDMSIASTSSSSRRSSATTAQSYSSPRSHTRVLGSPQTAYAHDPSVPDAYAPSPTRTRVSIGWAPRPSMSGRSLSSSEESDESGEAGEGDAPPPPLGIAFQDPFAPTRASASSSTAAASPRPARPPTNVDMGSDNNRERASFSSTRPVLETIHSDRTERGAELERERRESARR